MAGTFACHAARLAAAAFYKDLDYREATCSHTLADLEQRKKHPRRSVRVFSGGAFSGAAFVDDYDLSPFDINQERLKLGQAPLRPGPSCASAALQNRSPSLLCCIAHYLGGGGSAFSAEREIRKVD